MKNLLAFIFICCSLYGFTQDHNIIPKPLSFQAKQGQFTISPATVVLVTKPQDKVTADFFINYVKKYYGVQLKTAKQAKSNYIRFVTPTFIKAPENEERYTLNVSSKAVEVQGDGHPGTFRGMQSLIQLLPADKKDRSLLVRVNNVSIEDQPRFSYRGIHLDVCRHFFPVEFVKQYIDYLALHKFNTFHWHLTDDQGWRIEIKKYPKLMSHAAWRNGTIIGRYPGKGNDSLHYGGYYTQEQVKEVVKYAAARFITVIPEIEMPGHASAAIAAYPELSCFPDEDTKVAKGTAWAGPTKGKQVQQAWGVFDDIFCAGKEGTFKFLEGVLDEVMPLFPSRYLHIGGDEAPKTHWKRCPDCQQRIKTLGLKDEHELQSYFVQRMEKYVNTKGKMIIGWDEILEGGLAPNATVMSWQGEKGGIEAARQHHDVIMTPGNWCYFDHAQSRNEDSVTIGGYTPIEEVYSYEPVPAVLTPEQGKHILGAQANLWAEYIKNTRKVEYQLFPRIAAMSEVVWTAKEQKDSADFEKRLQTQFKRYDLWKVNYSRAFSKPVSTVLNRDGSIQWNVSSRDQRVKNITFFSSFDTIPVSEPGASQQVSGKIERQDTWQPGQIKSTINIDTPGYWGAYLYDSTGNFLYSVMQDFAFNKATAKKITTSIPPSPTYAGNGGAAGLVNAVRADKFASTEWLGWSGKPVEITIDLGKIDLVHEVILNVWKQEPSWIYLPATVEVGFSYTDEKGVLQYTAMEIEQPEEGWGDDRRLTFNFEPRMASTVTIKVTPVMSIPAGRQGAGRPAWVFIDEIEVN